MTPAQHTDLEAICHKLGQVQTTLSLVASSEDSRRGPVYRLMATLLDELTDELDAVANPIGHPDRGRAA